MSFLQALGSRVTDLRHRSGMSRQKLAKASGLSLRFLADVESGKANISIQKLMMLCNVLNVPVSVLTAGIDTGKQDEKARSLETIFSVLTSMEQKQLKELQSWLFAQQNRKAEIVALIGLRGAGKTTIGKKLASALKWKFVELDHRIEKAAGLNLQNIFEVHGEEYYRSLEREVLLDLILQSHETVVATGGGIVMRGDTYELLQRNCWTIWLKADPEDHWNRVLKQDPRPMTNYPDAFRQLQNLLLSREPLYARADKVVDTSKLGIPGSVKQIVTGLKEEGLVSRSESH